MDNIFQMLVALALTIVIEGAAMLLAKRSRKCVYYSLLANLLTNPALNLLMLFANMLFFNRYLSIVLLAVAETAAVLAEAKVYTYLGVFKKDRSLIFSIIFNLASLLIGMVAMWLIFGNSYVI